MKFRPRRGLLTAAACLLAAFGGLVLHGAAQSSGANATDLVPAKFVDVSAKVGVNFVHQAPHSSRKYLLETMGSGVALFDYDNDGRLDLYLVNGAPFGDVVPKGTIPQKTDPKYWNRLYHQKADGTFEDVTEKAGAGRRRLRHGRGRRRLRQRRLRGSLCHRAGRQPAVSQQRQRHLYRCDGESRGRRQRLVDIGGVGRSGRRRLPRPGRPAVYPVGLGRCVVRRQGQSRLLPSGCLSAHLDARLSQQRQRHLHRRSA